MNSVLRLILGLLVSALPVIGSANSDKSIKFEGMGEEKYFHFAVEPIAKSIPLRKLHRWKLVLEDVNGKPLVNAKVKVTGGMPAHKHGLPTKPQVRYSGKPGIYYIDGVLFNMGGDWVFNVIVKQSYFDRFTINLTL